MTKVPQPISTKPGSPRSLSPVIPTICFLTLIALAVISSTGCKKQDKAAANGVKDTTQWQAESGPTGKEIIESLAEKYFEAKFYEDKATLHVSYQLQGSYLEEPHSWNVKFDRNRGLQASIYDARIFADDKTLACFVYDFGSGNLDDQWQVHKVAGHIPIRKLFQDGICRHYITGKDELPVNNQNVLTAGAFFPPTIGLLTGQTTHQWLQQGTATRQPDEKVFGQTCYTIDILFRKLKWTVHVDQKTKLIRQIRYPNELLDTRLQNNPDVANLEVVARFAAAAFDTTNPDHEYKIPFTENAKLVRQFVPVPEPFPSNHAGKPVTALGLHNSADKPADQNDWRGKVTVLCWTNDAANESQLIETLQKVSSEHSPKDYSLNRVEVIQGALPGNPEIAKALKDLSLESQVSVLADYGFNGGRTLGIKQFPALAVIDRQGVLQFVKPLVNETVTQDELSEILLRIRSGDNISEEMRAEYEAFLNLYQERLARNMIRSNSGRDDGKMAQAAMPEHVHLNKSWSNSEFVQPGNIRGTTDDTQPRTKSQLTILDGWRTVIQLDQTGQELKRKELQLGQQESISVVRTGDKQTDLSVVFSKMGRAVRVLDEDLRTIHSVSIQTDQQRIRDANLFDFDNDGSDELILAFTGPRGTEIHELNAERTSRKISSQSFRSSTVFRPANGNRTMLFCDSSAQLRRIKSGDSNAQDVPCELVAATRVVSHQNNGRLAICAVGTNQQGQWTAIGLDENLEPVWTTAIGSQRFDTQIDSITFASRPNGTGLWAIAASDGSIRMVSDDGNLMDRWALGYTIHGIELMSQDNGYSLVISSEGKVESWTVSSEKLSHSMPVSASR